MKEYTHEELQAMYERLPKDVRDAMYSVDTGKIIVEISKKNRLHVDQQGELSSVIGYLMLGIIHPQDFIREVSSRLHTDDQTSRKIAEEINERIFKKVRESLKKVHNIGGAAEESEPKAEEKKVNAPSEEAAVNTQPNFDRPASQEPEVGFQAPVPEPAITHESSLAEPLPQEEENITEPEADQEPNETAAKNETGPQTPAAPETPTESPEAAPEIEAEPQPPTAPQSTGNIVEEKLQRIVKNPYEKRANDEQKTVDPSYADQNDPYREPVA